MLFILTISIQIALYLCCVIEHQKGKDLPFIQKFQNQNECQTLSLRNITITCSESIKAFQSKSLILEDVIFNCSSLQIISTGQINIKNELKFGQNISLLDKTDFESQTFYIQSKKDIIIQANVTHINQYFGYIILKSDQNIIINETSTIVGGSLAFHSVLNITIANSFIQNNFVRCNELKYLNFQPKLKQNFMKIVNNQYKINPLISQVIEERQNPLQLLEKYLNFEYTFLIFAEQAVNIQEKAILIGSKIAIYSLNAFIYKGAQISATGKGCPAQYGAGKGIFQNTIENCGAHGAHYVGYGGIGIPIGAKNEEEFNSNLLGCILYYKAGNYIFNNIPYAREQPYEGSGGSFIGYIEYFRQYEDQGAGGGVITVQCIDKIVINGLLESNGRSFNVQSMGSGGSGGLINIKSYKILGNGKIFVVGGNSDINGNHGEGSGGKIQIDCQNQLMNDIEVNQFRGEIKYRKGKRNITNKFISEELKNLVQADNGIYIPLICPAGQEANKNGGCDVCQQGQYKNYIYGNCKNATKVFAISAASLRSNQQKFDNFQDCYEICNKFGCDPARFYVKNIISYNGILYVLVYIMVICLGYICRRYLRMKPKKIDSIPIQYVKFDFDDQKFAKECQNNNTFQYKDLLYHKYRFQIYGTNNVNNYWFIQSHLPEQAEQIFDKKEFKDFSKKINKQYKWKKIDILITKVLQYIYYPLYWYYLSRVQKKVYKKAKKFIDNEPYPKFIIGLKGEDQKYIIMKMSKSEDYSLCFLDIFNYKKRNQKYFNIIIPTMIHFSGEGNYLKPYYVNIRDHFLQSAFYSCNSRRIINSEDSQKINVFCDNYNFHSQNSKLFELFIEKLNKYSYSLDYNCNLDILVERFVETIEFINKNNEDFFSKLGLKISFLIIEVPMDEIKQSFEQTISLIENNWEKDKLREKIKSIQLLKLHQKKVDVKISLFIYSETEDIAKIQYALNPQLEIDIDSNTRLPSCHQYQLNELSIDIASNQETCLEENNVSMQQSIFDYMENNNNFAEFVKENEKKEQEDDEVESEKNESGKEEENEIKIKQLITKWNIVAGYLRFKCLSHYNSKSPKELLLVILTSLIIIDISISTFYFSNIYYAFKDGFNKQEVFFFFLPFPFVNIISPFLALFLITSQAYGMAKGYFIFNLMSLISFGLNVLYSLFSEPCSLNYLIILLKVCSIITKFMIQWVGKSCISIIKKLNKSTEYKK